ncbi:hypothetical protein A2U01_0001309 [Trifolium medium]|uniref:Uncharacterized protein n=1 Tax=Trifolium medium TaxID=97028 RepID=A0A392LZX8_9FABA|nr:hypothetical protein [Trifolium medium]
MERREIRRKGKLLISDNYFNEEAAKTIFWKENLRALDSDLNMHLKFSLQPGPLFVKKEILHNADMEAFKAEVREELSILNAKQDEFSRKQDEISVDLKTILSILNRKP